MLRSVWEREVSPLVDSKAELRNALLVAPVDMEDNILTLLPFGRLGYGAAIVRLMDMTIAFCYR